MKILNVVNEEGMDVNGGNLKKYFDYLNDHLDFSDLVTGMEDFRWEEYYVFGPGDQKEYEKFALPLADLKSVDKDLINFQCGFGTIDNY
jgi:hypothetical protein